MLAVEGSVFNKPKAPGDFAYMCARPEYQDSLFIVLENYLDMHTMHGVVDGGGTACLRSKCFHETLADASCCAVGVATGWSKESGGFCVLDQRARRVIDLCFQRALRVLLYYKDRFKRVIYSCDAQRPHLVGAGIFKDTISPQVTEYISHKIRELPVMLRVSSSLPSLRLIYLEEIKDMGYALLVQELSARRSQGVKRARS